MMGGVRVCKQLKLLDAPHWCIDEPTRAHARELIKMWF